MPYEIILVLARTSVAEILAAGGVRSSAVDRNRAKACRYAVICHDAEGGEDHGHAFMVAKLKDVVRCTGAEGDWLILFSRYAVGAFGSQWNGRDPVAYHSAAEFATGYDGIEFAALPFTPMPKVTPRILTTSTGISYQ